MIIIVFLMLFLFISVRIDTGAPRFILLLRSVQEELSVTLSVKTSGNLRAYKLMWLLVIRQVSKCIKDLRWASAGLASCPPPLHRRETGGKCTNGSQRGGKLSLSSISSPPMVAPTLDFCGRCCSVLSLASLRVQTYLEINRPIFQ